MGNRLRFAAASLGTAAGILAVAVMPAPAWAASAGSLDTGFGNAGTVLTDFGGEDNGYGTALHADGKLVVAGYARHASYDFALARYNQDGSLDTTFGTGGKVITDFGGAGGTDIARAAAIDPDGRIVVVGSTNASGSTDFAVARYNHDGSLDSTFGRDGIARADASGKSRFDGANAVAVQPDGGIVAAGQVDGPNGVDFGVVRYLQDGTVDTKFGKNGITLADLGADDYPGGVAIGPDGSVAVAGYSNASSGTDIAVARFRSGGGLDPAFGKGGSVLTDIRNAHSYDEARTVAVQPDGSIVVAGSSDADGSRDFALARYLANGSLDSSFGTGGTVLTDLTGAGHYDAALAVTLTRNGIVAAGAAGLVRNTDAAVARYGADGSLDTTFGTGGTATADLSGSSASDTAFGVAVRPDGRVVVTGSASKKGGVDFAVAQFLS